MKRTINGKNISLATLTDSQLDSIYNQAIEYLKKTEKASYLDEIIEDSQADNIFAGLRSRKSVKMAAFMLDELDTTTYDHHHQISPETLEWGGFMSADSFLTQNKDRLAAHVFTF